MAVKEEDCRAITEAVQRNHTIFAVGHVLRYTPYTAKFKALVSSGAIGKVINIQHLEPVGAWHFAHSYVRGNWRNTKTATFSLMAKSCHDVDWVIYIMGKKLNRVSSFGSLNFFKKSEKPKGAGDRCMECAVESTCPYSAKKIYLDRALKGDFNWPVKVIVEIPTVETITEALLHGPYGRCVYECDNDVADNQVVNMEFEDGTTASFTMIAFSQEICVRKTRIFGSLGQIEGDGEVIKHYDFLTEKTTSYNPDADVKIETQLNGHGGADYHLMNSFIEAIRTNNPSKILSNAEQTLQSHLGVFAAEKSRLTSKIVDLEW